jgi:tetratricopeptide (TPR) repeat protein
LENGENVQAIDALSSAIELADLWLARFYRGRAFLEGGFFAEALDDFLACQARHGEATAVFLDDLPTYRYMATLPYWLGRAQEGLGMTAEARENYTTFVGYRPEGDPLVDDARQRLQ